MKNIVFVIVLSVALQSQARQLEQCQLVHELRAQGFPENQMRDWVCLVEHESLRSTHAIGKLNGDGSWDHGLFQINDRYWCNRGNTPGKDCNVTCQDLRSDDIGAASECAKKIYARHGFSAWTAWKNYCQGAKPDISHCG